MDAIEDILGGLEGLIHWKRDDRGGGHYIQAIFAANPAAAGAIEGFVRNHPDAPVLVVAAPGYPQRATQRVLLAEAMAEQLHLEPDRSLYTRTNSIAQSIQRRGIEVIVILHTERFVSPHGKVRKDEVRWLISLLKSDLAMTRLMMVANTEAGEAAILFEGWVCRHFVQPEVHNRAQAR